MLVNKKKLAVAFVYFIGCLVSSALIFVLSAEVWNTTTDISVIIFTCVAILTLTLSFVSNVADYWLKYLESKDLSHGVTATFSEFSDSIKKIHTMDDFVTLVHSTLELRADCSVLFYDREKSYVLYTSSTSVISSEKNYQEMIRTFSRFTTNGVYFFDEEMSLLSNRSEARGFFIIFDTICFFVFCSATRYLSNLIFPLVAEELRKFYTRNTIIKGFSSVNELALEWEMLAQTQRYFLPRNLPKINRLSMASYYTPLINVSGDYYTVIEISKNKALILLGDVSGKGFSAALIMGIVINMVKTFGAKTDLANLVKTVEKNIKAMNFEDKYTVLFVGIIDTEVMELSYINASMADITVLTQTPNGYNNRRLPSNCSILGLIDLGSVEVVRCPLFWNDVLFLATDGISECTDTYGNELGSTDKYEKLIKLSAEKTPQEFIHDVNELATSHIHGKTFKDDITMLVIKVEK